jgi:hypothetical protein
MSAERHARGEQQLAAEEIAGGIDQLADMDAGDLAIRRVRGADPLEIRAKGVREHPQRRHRQSFRPGTHRLHESSIADPMVSQFDQAAIGPAFVE